MDMGVSKAVSYSHVLSNSIKMLLSAEGFGCY